MKLTYRGATYDYNPPAVNYGDFSQSGTYKGLDVRFRNRPKALVLPSTLKLVYRGNGYTMNPQGAPAAHPPLQLTYRGSHYTLNPTGQTVPATTPVAATPVATTTTPSSIQSRARQLMMDHHRSVKRRQQSMLTRLDERIGLDGATQYWNHIQGKPHPAFIEAYDRSPAALS